MAKKKPKKRKGRTGKSKKAKKQSVNELDSAELEEIVDEEINEMPQFQDSPREISLMASGAKVPVLEKVGEQEFDIRRFFPSANIRAGEGDENDEKQENLYASAQNNYAANTGERANQDGVTYTEAQNILLSEEDRIHRDTKRIFGRTKTDYMVNRNEGSPGMGERTLGPERSDEQEKTRKYMARGEERNR